VRAGRTAALVAARVAVPFPAGGARRRERRPPSHRARRKGEMFPSGQSQRSAGEVGSLTARAREKISAARRSWRSVDGQAERGTLPRPGRRTPHCRRRGRGHRRPQWAEFRTTGPGSADCRRAPKRAVTALIGRPAGRLTAAESIAGSRRSRSARQRSLGFEVWSRKCRTRDHKNAEEEGDAHVSRPSGLVSRTASAGRAAAAAVRARRRQENRARVRWPAASAGRPARASRPVRPGA
jgi:hypothetical protein